MAHLTRFLLAAALSVALPSVAWSQVGPGGGQDDPAHVRDQDRDGDPAQDCPGFVDEDGDGVCDVCGGDHTADRSRERDQDRGPADEPAGPDGEGDGPGDGECDADCPGFVDENGDGVCDHCDGDHAADGTPRRRFLRGDADGNGRRDIGDPIHALRAMFQRGHMECPDAADANDDGVVDVSDAVTLLRHLFQNRGGDDLPVPFRNRGEDPTPDGLGCG